MPEWNDRNRPLYMIGVAAELAGVHPQTLRAYEQKGLVTPQRTSGNTRMYSQADIERLSLINELTGEGINLAGVIRILDLQGRLVDRDQEIDDLHQTGSPPCRSRARAGNARKRELPRAVAYGDRRSSSQLAFVNKCVEPIQRRFA